MIDFLLKIATNFFALYSTLLRTFARMKILRPAAVTAWSDAPLLAPLRVPLHDFCTLCRRSSNQFATHGQILR